MTDVLKQRVNAAVGVAVKRKLRESGKPPEDQRQMAFAVGRRIQGEYGAALRKAAEVAPGLSAADLCEAVVWVQEYPWEYAEGSEAAATVNAGQRDRARARNYGPFAEDRPVASSLTEHISEMRDLVAKGRDAFDARDRRPPEPVEHELVVIPPSVRQALDAGKTIAAENRKARKERAMSEGAK